MGVNQPARAQTGGLLVPPEILGELVYVPFPVNINLHGKLDDWQNIPAQTVTKEPYVSANPGENSPLFFVVVADNENLYLSLFIVDKNIITGQHEPNCWNEDSLKFYLNISADLNATVYGPGIF